MEVIKTNLCNIHNLSMDDAITIVKQKSQSDGLDVIVTPNIDHLARLCNGSNCSDLKKIYDEAALCLCDSKIFEKLLRLKGKKVTEVIPGSTLTAKLFDDVITDNDKVLVIGGNTDVINKLRNKYPQLSIEHHNPPMGFINKPDEVDVAIQTVRNIKPNYVFLAVGSPRQEILAQKLKQKTEENGVVLCIGASILFIVGDEKRAPTWMQKMHCEWLYRMLQDPKRLVARYYKNFILLPKILFRL